MSCNCILNLHKCLECEAKEKWERLNQEQKLKLTSYARILKMNPNETSFQEKKEMFALAEELQNMGLGIEIIPNEYLI